MSSSDTPEKTPQEVLRSIDRNMEFLAETVRKGQSSGRIIDDSPNPQPPQPQPAPSAGADGQGAPAPGAPPANPPPPQPAKAKGFFAEFLGLDE